MSIFLGCTMTPSLTLPVCVKRHAGLAARLLRVLTTTAADWQRTLSSTLTWESEPPSREVRRCSLLSQPATRAAYKRRFN